MTAFQAALPLRDVDPVPTAIRHRINARQIPDTTVWRAIELIDGSGIVEKVAEWKEEDRQGPGGRSETFPLRALLVAMMLSALTDRPMLAQTFTDVLFKLISPTMRHAVGVPKPPGQLDHRGWQAVYRNVRTRFHGLLTVMDPSPTPKNRRLAHDRFVLLTELRRNTRTPEEWQKRDDRLDWFVNQVIEISLRQLPREVRRRWKGSVAVDATVVPAFAQHDRKRGRSGEVAVHSSDPDAGWYVRQDSGTGSNGASWRRSVWGYELSIAVSGADHPDQPGAFPSLVVGMAPLHKPGVAPGRNGMRALRSVRQRGHPAKYLAGDLAYTNAKPEDFQLPARALGYDPVLDYKIDQLGLQGSHEGMLLIEGGWYCPSIPKVLITATKDFREKVIDETTYRARLTERWKYRMLPKASADDEGHVRLRCPASQPNPTARCELKPGSERASTRTRLRVRVLDGVQADPPKACTQQSVTLPPEVGAKLSSRSCSEATNGTPCTARCGTRSRG